MTAPNVTITKAGEAPSMDVARVISRIQNLKLAIAKPNIKKPKRALLQAEIDGLLEQVGGLKSALDGL